MAMAMVVMVHCLDVYSRHVVTSVDSCFVQAASFFILLK